MPRAREKLQRRNSSSVHIIVKYGNVTLDGAVDFTRTRPYLWEGQVVSPRLPR